MRRYSSIQLWFVLLLVLNKISSSPPIMYSHQGMKFILWHFPPCYLHIARVVQSFIDCGKSLAKGVGV